MKFHRFHGAMTNQYLTIKQTAVGNHTLCQGLRDVHRAMLSTGAANGDGKVATVVLLEFQNPALKE